MKAATYYAVLLALVLGVGCGTTPKGASTTTESTEELLASGHKYYLGEEVPLNYSKAAEFYMKAAKRGSVEAMFALGCLYQNGQGVPTNYGNAAKWWTKSAQLGSSDAQYLLGMCYKEGSGVQKDPIEAYKWLIIAAESGQPKPEHVEARDHFGRNLAPDTASEAKRRAMEWCLSFKAKNWWYDENGEKVYGTYTEEEAWKQYQRIKKLERERSNPKK